VNHLPAARKKLNAAAAAGKFLGQLHESQRGI